VTPLLPLLSSLLGASARLTPDGLLPDGTAPLGTEKAKDLTPFYVAFSVAFGLLYVVQFALIWGRRNIQPVKSKGPRVLLLTLTGNYTLLFFLALLTAREWNNLPRAKGFCDAYKWMVTIMYPLATIPFLLRYFRVRFIFSSVPSSFRAQPSDAGWTNIQLNNAPMRKSNMREDHILRILLLILLFVAFLRICLEELFTDLSEIVGNGCQDSKVLTSVMLVWVLIHAIELIAFCWVTFDDKHVLRIMPEFSMGKEMGLMSILWLVCTASASAILVIRFRDTNDHAHLDQWYWKFNTVVDVVYFFGAATIGVTWPLVRTFTESGFACFPLFGDCTVLRSLEGTLSQITALQVFRSFLIQECTVENLLLWVEIELFKDNPIVRQGRRIYNKFLSEESELEVSTVSDNLKRKVRQRLSARSETIKGNIGDVFDEVQAEVFEYMKRESYPRFLASSQSMMLMEILDREEFLCQALKNSNML